MKAEANYLSAKILPPIFATFITFAGGLPMVADNKSSKYISTIDYEARTLRDLRLEQKLDLFVCERCHVKFSDLKMFFKAM